MEEKKQPQQQQLQIELTPEVANGTYSNLAIINHSNQEFIIDFVAALPGIPKARVNCRQILTPENAKRLLFALQDNVVKYEQKFGTIEQRGNAAPKADGRTAAPFGMRPPVFPVLHPLREAAIPITASITPSIRMIEWFLCDIIVCSFPSCFCQSCFAEPV